MEIKYIIIIIIILLILFICQTTITTRKHEHYCPVMERQSVYIPTMRYLIDKDSGVLPELFFHLNRIKYVYWDAPYDSIMLMNFNFDDKTVDVVINNGPPVKRKVDISYPYMIVVKEAYYGEDYTFFIQDRKLMLENNGGQYELERYKHPLYA